MSGAMRSSVVSAGGADVDLCDDAGGEGGIGDGVVACLSEERVIAGEVAEGDERVIAVGAEHDVVLEPAVEGVVAFPAKEIIASAAAEDAVVGVSTAQGVVAPPAVDVGGLVDVPDNNQIRPGRRADLDLVDGAGVILELLAVEIDEHHVARDRVAMERLELGRKLHGIGPVGPDHTKCSPAAQGHGTMLSLLKWVDHGLLLPVRVGRVALV